MVATEFSCLTFHSRLEGRADVLQHGFNQTAQSCDDRTGKGTSERRSEEHVRSATRRGVDVEILFRRVFGEAGNTPAPGKRDGRFTQEESDFHFHQGVDSVTNLDVSRSPARAGAVDVAEDRVPVIVGVEIHDRLPTGARMGVDCEIRLDPGFPGGMKG